MIFVPQDDSGDDGNTFANVHTATSNSVHGDEAEEGDTSSSSSSSDDNDSTAAAHAAAIGHSPQPIRPTLEIPASVNSKSSTTVDGDGAVQPTSAASAMTPAKKEVSSTEACPPAVAVAHSTADQGGEEAPMDMDTSPEGTTSETQQAQSAGSEANQSKDKHQGEDEQGHSVATEQLVTADAHGKERTLKYYCPYNLNERDGDENTPLHVAIHSRKLEHVKLLLEAGANVHKKSDGSAPLHTAISMAALPQHEQFGYDCLVLLSQFDADLTAKDDAMHTPLYLACKFNLPGIVTFLLSSVAGMSTLNTKADRAGGRPLHAAAKFDTLSRPFGSRSAATAVGAARAFSHHHPDGSLASSMNHIPTVGKVALGGKQAPQTISAPLSQLAGLSPEAMLTQILLRTKGIEIDALNTVGQTPLHIACLRGNWVVARLLVQGGADPSIADRRGFTPGQLAHKRGMPIPVDLIISLGGPPSSGTVAPPRDLIVDPHGNTLLISHELCLLHRSCVPITRDSSEEPPPENVRRLTVLVDEDTGILRGGEFGRCVWEGEARRAAMVDVLKVRLILSR